MCRFFAANSTVQRVTATAAAANKMSAALLNSGTVGVGVADVVGLAEADAVVVAVAVGLGLDDADVVLTYTFPV